MLRNVVGLVLIAVGLALIVLRARKKGDIQLTGGIWDFAGQLGDALYAIGFILVAIGVALIAPGLNLFDSE